MAPVTQIATPTWRLNGGSRRSPRVALAPGALTTRSDHRWWLDRRDEDRGFTAVDVS
jgi:hypothetical protein